MSRVLIVSLILCCIQIHNVVGENPNQAVDSNIDIITVQDATEYFQKNLNQSFVRLQKTVLPRNQIRYTLGRRVSGDRLVATNSQSQQWSQVQDVTLTLAYPRTGTGNIVSFVDINVLQSSNLGQAYVSVGGIGQRRIAVVIQAYRTYYFRHSSQIFGY